MTTPDRNEAERFLKALDPSNEQGAGIFITVNATDFKGRSADNINRIRSVFADLDGAPLEPVIAEGALRPHIIADERRPAVGDQSLDPDA